MEEQIMYKAFKSNPSINNLKFEKGPFFHEMYNVDGSQESMTSTISELEQKMIEFGMDESSANLFKFSIYEAIQNAQQHGYNKTGENVVVTAIFSKPRYIVSVISKGDSPFDFGIVEEQIKDQNFLKFQNGKRGFKAMYMLCDQVIVGIDNNCTDVFLEKIN